MSFMDKGHGGNMSDLATDGCLNLVVGAGGLYPGALLTTSVYRQTHFPGHYLNLRLVSTRSNHDAIRARIRLRAGGVVQFRLVSGGSGFGCPRLEQHFGLKALMQMDSPWIRLPNGHVQELVNLSIHSTLRVVEGEVGRE